MTPEQLARWWELGGFSGPPGVDVSVTGHDPVLPARHRIGEAAAAALALVGARVAALEGAPGPVTVDVTHAAASLQGFLHQRLDRPGPFERVRDATVALYPTADERWIHLHGGFAHLGDGLLDVLGLTPEDRGDAARIAAAVLDWSGQELEDTLAARGLCGALVRTVDEWTAHPQGAAVAASSTVEVVAGGGSSDEADVEGWAARPVRADRPLEGLRVLDLTRVLAGPTCGRTLALFGADVLRIGAERLPSIEPFVMDTGPGKRNAFLDLADPADAAQCRALVRDADVVVCGYRSGALDRLGFGPDDLLAMRPGLVVALVNCYGHTGPWVERPGWEQLAQAASGIAAIEGTAERPRLLPAAANDYTTGYLTAAGVLDALGRSREEIGSYVVRTSLCATAAWLVRGGSDADPTAATGLSDIDDHRQEVDTAWGRLSHLRPPLAINGIPARWDRPPAPLGHDEPQWLPR